MFAWKKAYSLDDHRATVVDIANSVKSFHERGEPFRIYHSSTVSTGHISFDRSEVVDTSSPVNIILVAPNPDNPAFGTCIADANVPMDALVKATLKYGYIPKAAPEFLGMTVEGAFHGTAGESSSWKYGIFDRIVNSSEMILPTEDWHEQMLLAGKFTETG